jgi:hypothetical protein
LIDASRRIPSLKATFAAGKTNGELPQCKLRRLVVEDNKCHVEQVYPLENSGIAGISDWGEPEVVESYLIISSVSMNFRQLKF